MVILYLKHVQFNVKIVPALIFQPWFKSSSALCDKKTDKLDGKYSKTLRNNLSNCLWKSKQLRNHLSNCIKNQLTKSLSNCLSNSVSKSQNNYLSIRISICLRNHLSNHLSNYLRVLLVKKPDMMEPTFLAQYQFLCKGPFKYSVIKILTFLDPTQPPCNQSYCNQS